MLLRAALAGVVAGLVVLGVACLAALPAPTPDVPFTPEDRPSLPVGEAESAGRRERTGSPAWVPGRSISGPSRA